MIFRISLVIAFIIIDLFNILPLLLLFGISFIARQLLGDLNYLVHLLRRYHHLLLHHLDPLLLYEETLLLDVDLFEVLVAVITFLLR
jgi:hypothetical protein